MFPKFRLFVTCWLIYAVHWAPFMIREQFPAITLATEGTLNVERFVGWSADIFPGPGGGAFINNNPGASIAGAIPLFVARPLLNAVERWNDALPSSIHRSQHASDFPASQAVRARREFYIMTVAFLTVAGLMAPVSALTVTLLGWTLWSAGVPKNRAIGVALLYGFATPVFQRTGYLNHNLLVGHAGLIAALLLWDRARARLTLGRAIAAGALCGFAVLCDYSGVIVIAIGGLYTWLRTGDESAPLGRRFRVAACYGAGAIPMLLTLAVYQWWAFGHSALPSQQFMPAIEQTSRGYRGVDWPSFELAWMNFFDPRFGLFAVCPILALSFVAPWVRGGACRLPTRETGLAFLFFAGFTLFCAANQYSSLQWTTGIRYLVPAIPGLLLLSSQVLQVLPSPVRWTLIPAAMAMSWMPALTHEAWPALVAGAGAFELSWVHRLAEYGVLAHPRAVTATLLAATASAVTSFWKPELAAARARHRP